MSFLEWIIPEETNGIPIKQPVPLFMQFVPAIVTNVFVNDNADNVDVKDVNAITVQPHIDEGFDHKSINTQKYYPLFRGMVDVPTHGDQVLICDFGGVKYYLGPINTINNPNFNIDHLNSIDSTVKNTKKKNNSNKINSKTNLGLSKSFPLMPLSRLQKKYINRIDDIEQTRKGIDETHGDMIFEGRHGNSVRIGSRSYFPHIILSNGRLPLNTYESFTDSSILSFTSKGTLAEILGDDGNFEQIFMLSSDSIEEPKHQIGNDLFNYEWEDNQIFLQSEKITFNAWSDSIFLSALKNVVIGSGQNIRLQSNFDIRFNSERLFIGGEVSPENEVDTEPLVRGEKLRLFLKDMIGLLKQFKVSGTVGGISGPPEPATMTELTRLGQFIDNPDFLSDIGFIESENRG